jgi:uncharacterized protein YdhG (YjbR/CyaY superfamily)
LIRVRNGGKKVDAAMSFEVSFRQSDGSRKEGAMATDPAIKQYFSDLPPEQRRELQRLRKTIRAAAPGAIERISYRMPTFSIHDRPLVGYAAFKNHCSLFPMSMRVFEEFEEELEPFRASKGTLHFRPDQPLPTSLVTRLVKSRVRENAAKKR